ncbi:MAG: radical SAM protein [Muribaculaceae bacterium]|nr:radical SAM protein [Muribaculaceae bacterium]
MEKEFSAPLIGIVRHRLATDGKGVTTLVAFHSCPLRCKYCLNAQCLDPKMVWRTVTTDDLLNELLLDNLYFLATGGGVTFGGGEPLLRSEFIDEFCRIKVPEWKVNLETSLNVDRHHLERVMPHISEFFIDIKDTNPAIYKKYTTRDNSQVLDNLRWLLEHDGMAEKIIVRLPHIPNHNTQADVDRSRALLEEMGVKNFDEFDYIVNRGKGRGKKKESI